MMSRLQIKNPSHFVEFPDTPAGRMQIEAFRKRHVIFKGSRIRPIIQAHPRKIECGTVYEFGKMWAK
jgi:hypothetical protein